MQREGEHDGIRIGVKRGVERAVGIEAREVVARGYGRGAVRLHRGEGTTGDNPPVSLEQERVHLGLELPPDIRVVGRVERAVGIEAGETVATDGGTGAAGLDARKIPAKDDTPVGLNPDGPDRAVSTGIEGRVNRAIEVESRQIAARRAADRRELAGDDQLAVGLQGHGVDVAIDIGIEAVGSGRRLGEAGGQRQDGGGKQGADRGGETLDRAGKRDEWHGKWEPGGQVCWEEQ